MMNQGKVLFRKRPLLFGKLHARHYTKPTVLRRVVRGTGIVTLATTLTLGVGGTIMYNTNDQFRHVMNALDRCRLAGVAGTMVALDYQKTLTKQYSSEQEYDEAKRKCHLRCAHRVLDAIQRLGGVYVKLGQHISVMQYLLPPEWCVTMSILQDRCDPTEPEAIRALFESDYVGVEELFDEFDWTPMGVASLAQVHKARLKGSDQWVAVKLQHPNLDEYCQLDMDTVSFILEIVKRVFPDFGFQWFAEEIRESIPKELDFVQETMNSRRVYSNFEKEIRNHKTSLVIPEVIWAKRRIMCMEFIHGTRVDDLEYMKEHNIDPREVSTELTRIFSEMIYLHGFVHCDPHPGNVFIRPAKDPKHSKYNFDLVLLDHGLYRELTNELRVNYAHLWTSLIKGDEAGIKEYSLRVGGTDVYQLFACMLTGREWTKISESDLNSVRHDEEVGRIAEGAVEYLVEVADILGKLPRTVLLLLKTNDLLRHVDEKLNNNEPGAIPDDHITYVIMGNYCAKAVWLDTKQYLLDKMNLMGFSLNLFKELFRAWWQYTSLDYALWIYQLTSFWAEKVRRVTA